MSVLEILKLISSLSVGKDNPTDKELLIYLRYLNLVHFELYRRTVLYNEDAVNLVETLIVNDGAASKTVVPIFKPKLVWLNESNVVLERTTLSVIQATDPDIQRVGNCSKWYYHRGFIFVYPLDSRTINISYLPQPILFDINTTAEEIPYPVFFHQVLVDGACYYLFQGEGGLRDPIKVIEAKERYAKGQAELISYLSSFSVDPNLSTYRDI